jgi:hypothetical protein
VIKIGIIITIAAAIGRVHSLAGVVDSMYDSKQTTSHVQVQDSECAPRVCDPTTPIDRVSAHEKKKVGRRLNFLEKKSFVVDRRGSVDFFFFSQTREDIRRAPVDIVTEAAT